MHQILFSKLEDLASMVSKRIRSILDSEQLDNRPEPRDVDNARDLEKISDISRLMMNMSHNTVSLKRKEFSREKKRNCMFESRQSDRFGKLLVSCADKLGAEAVVKLFCELGRELGVKDYNVLMKICIDKARETEDEEIAIEEVAKVFHILKSMREQGFQLEEKTYRPLLLHVTEKGMVEEFQFFIDVIKDNNPSSISRLGYYEMMLWLRVNNEEKIRDVCAYIANNDGPDTSELRENYLLALCEGDRKKDILQVLEIVDMKKLLSTESKAKIFQSLGRLLLEPTAEKFLLDFKLCDHEADNITNFIASYAVSMPNLAMEDVVSKFKELHQTLKVPPSSSSYEKLILHSCDSLKAPIALDTVDEMCEGGFNLSTEVLHSILQTCVETHEYVLAHRIYSTIHRYNLKLNDEIIRCLIVLFTKLKDFESAYKLLDELDERGLKPTTGMYNAIMGEHFREKNIRDGLRSLEHMQRANVRPDLLTLSYLISNSETTEDINKYYAELKRSGLQPTKQIFTTLIRAYAACGELEKAKQVILDPFVPVNILNEIKGVLVSTLASHGQLSEALLIYEEIRQAGKSLEPKTIINLIECTRSDGELDRLLRLLEELHDQDYWIDGCCRIVLYCIRNNHTSSAVDLCKQLKDKFPRDAVMEVLFEKVFAFIEQTGSTHLQSGVQFLWELKDKLGLFPPKVS
ncbi:pentatricopeptide repeat-containing protein At4g04790, mitochondrial isoform X2 [Neltuma alba]|uniref:pentatricopeptide repeat-containing protein At4g04790, mitochondrial isoform X2 n=1 Tax=Neltuma alba TaxID=207710 RepID=UPI0010A51E27|nr:pentatricopeptide repeat-containing protein At4g04790, mitochondrial-like isoform X2 [Prosopis alba]